MQEPAPQQVSLTTKNTSSLTMGIAAVVLGVSALVVGWVPYLGLLAIPMACLGALLALLGVLFALAKKFQGVTLPLLGGALSVAGIALPVMTTATTAEVVNDSLKRAQDQRANERAQLSAAQSGVASSEVMDKSRVDAEAKADLVRAQIEEQERASVERLRALAAEAQTKQDAVRASEEAAIAEKVSYVQNQLDIYEVKASYRNSLLDGKVPGVSFKLKNRGTRVLEKVAVTFYFEDKDGATIFEDTFTPIHTSPYSASKNSGPLKAGYVWQMEKGRFYSSKSVPSEWAEGKFRYEVSKIEFADEAKR